MTKVLLLGATGTVGQATARCLLREGYEVLALVRPGTPALDGIETVATPLTDPDAVANSSAGHGIDAVISCLASRTGAPDDAWAIDHDAHVNVLNAALAARVDHFVLLSAICVQKPRLAFQHAKRAFEHRLTTSGLRFSIVRPTTLFKSVSGQVARVTAGKPYLIFGDGRLTATKPISDDDLARYLVACLTDPACANKLLPIGGPGPALTPLQMGGMLFEMTGQPARYRRVPPKLFTAAARALDAAARLRPSLAAKAEFARIAHYYATESMLVWDEDAARYDADATPEFGSDTLRAHYAALLSGDAHHASGAHQMFD